MFCEEEVKLALHPKGVGNTSLYLLVLCVCCTGTRRRRCMEQGTADRPHNTTKKRVYPGNEGSSYTRCVGTERTSRDTASVGALNGQAEFLCFVVYFREQTGWQSITKLRKVENPRVVLSFCSFRFDRSRSKVCIQDHNAVEQHEPSIACTEN